MRRRRLVVALALGLAACGKDDAPAKGGGGASPGPQVATVRDTAPWSDDPAGAAWDACAWIPEGSATDAWVFDLASARAGVTGRGPSALRWQAPEVRRTWVRTLGLPEAALVRVIAVQDPSRYFVCDTSASDAELAAAMTAKGLVEGEAEDGARPFRSPDSDVPAAVLFQRRVLISSDRDAYASALAARRGKARSLRDAPGVKEACAAAPKGLPAQIEAGDALRRRRKADPPAPRAAVGVQEIATRMRQVQVLACVSEPAMQETRSFLQRVLAARPDARPDDVFTMGARGAVLRFTLDVAHAADLSAARRSAERSLSALVSAVVAYRDRRGAIPTAEEGLKGLEAEPDLLDDVLGVVPSDPWGRPFAYQPAHPRFPDGFVLRSLGPDGEIDTEDDVLPPVRDR